ncbi:MAG: hypothetical protein JSU96_00050 [Acidobacteriota bacterium]|nr:MAG: hypothetical protein JSU96_00050 [Acidobacteriota bacterium]
MLRTLLRTTLLASLICSGSLLLAADDLSANFNVEPGGLLKVEAEHGSVEVTTGSGSEVSLEIDLKNWDEAEFFDEFTVDFTRNGNTVNVLIDSKKTFSSWFNWGRSKGFVLRAEIPYRFNVDLRTSGGSIDLGDLKGEARSETSGGSLRFGSIDGPIWGRTSGGSIDLDGATGGVDVETSGGSIRLGEVIGRIDASTSGGSISAEAISGEAELGTSGGAINVRHVAGSLRAETSGGNISAVFSEQPSGDCYLSTSGGGIAVRVASQSRLDLDARASGGNVRSDLDLQVRDKTKSHLEGTLNGSGPRLVLRTSGGGISIERY